jgi:hypothetical protein
MQFHASAHKAGQCVLIIHLFPESEKLMTKPNVNVNHLTNK